MRRILQTVAATVLFLAAIGAGAQEKYALVIGNGAYASVTKLKNPTNDAADMAAALKGLGFKVDTLTDAGLGEMEDAVVRLGTRLGQSTGAWGFFFYAGHGVQSNGVNYLIPVDGDIKSETFLKSKALNAQSVLDTLAQAGNGLNVVVLDACRDNPFGWSRGGNRGLVPVGGQPSGSIVAYATSVGSTAQDGTGRNGLFTSQLLKNLKTPGLEIAEVFKRTGADVKKASGNLQIPAIYNQFFDSAYLAGGPKGGAANPAQPDFGAVTLLPGSVSVTVATTGILTLAGQTAAVPAGGTLPVSNLAPGDYPLSVTYPDGQTESQTVTVTSGQTVTVGFRYAPPPAAQGSVRRSWLGASMVDVSPDLAADLRLPSLKGSFTPHVFPSSPADQAGILPGDFVTAINGAPVVDTKSLVLAVGQLSLGKGQEFTLVRNGQTLVKTVILDSRPADAVLKTLKIWPGFVVTPLTDGLRSNLDLAAGAKGLVVSRVEEKSSADLAGLQQADLLQAVNGKPVLTAAEFYRCLNEPRAQVKLTVIRDKKELSLSVSR